MPTDYANLVDGEMMTTESWVDVVNPATEEVLASVASAEIADADAALDAAQAAFADWAGRKPRERAEVLRKAFELMTARLEDFARLITLENGKARGDAMGEAAYAAEFFRWFSEEAVRADGLITHAPASGARIVVQHCDIDRIFGHQVGDELVAVDRVEIVGFLEGHAEEPAGNAVPEGRAAAVVDHIRQIEGVTDTKTLAGAEL